MDEYLEAIRGMECVASVTETSKIGSNEESQHGPYKNIELVQKEMHSYDVSSEENTE